MAPDDTTEVDLQAAAEQMVGDLVVQAEPVSEFQAMFVRLRSVAAPLVTEQRYACPACRDTEWIIRRREDGEQEAVGCKCRERALWIQRGRRQQAALSSLHWADAITRSQPILPSQIDVHSKLGMDWAKAWTPSSPGAVIWGIPGSGKSTLLCRLLLRMGPPCEQQPQALGFGVCLVSVPRLLGDLATAQHRGGYSEMLAALGAVDVLAIDDLGVGKLYRGWPAQLWAVLDARWSAGQKPVLVTSNIDPMQLRTHLEHDPREKADLDRALDRLRALAPTSVQYDAPASRR